MPIQVSTWTLVLLKRFSSPRGDPPSQEQPIFQSQKRTPELLSLSRDYNEMIFLIYLERMHTNRPPSDTAKVIIQI